MNIKKAEPKDWIFGAWFKVIAENDEVFYGYAGDSGMICIYTKTKTGELVYIPGMATVPYRKVKASYRIPEKESPLLRNIKSWIPPF